jgi:hypothetical protein
MEKQDLKGIKRSEEAVLLKELKALKDAQELISLRELMLRIILEVQDKAVLLQMKDVMVTLLKQSEGRPGLTGTDGVQGNGIIDPEPIG